MADNTTVQSTELGSLPVGLSIATRSVTYSGDALQHIAPTSIVDLTGSDDAKVATDVQIGTIIGAVTEAAPGTDTASSGLNGRLQRIAQNLSTFLGSLTEAAPGTDTASSGLNGRLQRVAQRLTSLIALFPAALGVNGGVKVDIVGDTGQAAVVDSDHLAVVTHNTKYISNGATADVANVLTPKFAKIAAASSGDNTLVAAVTSKKIRVLAYNFISNGTVNAKFQSGAAGTDLTGLKYCVANSGICAPMNQFGWFESASGVLLNLNLSGAVAVGGELVYVEV